MLSGRSLLTSANTTNELLHWTKPTYQRPAGLGENVSLNSSLSAGNIKSLPTGADAVCPSPSEISIKAAVEILKQQASGEGGGGRSNEIVIDENTPRDGEKQKLYIGDTGVNFDRRQRR